MEHPEVPMHIGEISKGSGISTSCIRYYEKHGFIPKAVRGR
jgi:DNA-binding transcriptional MerR regulator